MWEVFVRDIFPFLLTNLGSGSETLGQILKEIESTKPFYDFSGSSFKIRTRRSSERQNYEARITLLNQNINDWISEINRLVNDFYNDHFRENGDIELRIALEYSNELEFGDIVQKHNYSNREYQIPSKRYIDLNKPIIKLKVWHKDSNNNWIAVHRPQTYFNEAKLTQIALSVIHYQFESIHPFYDGNGRTGRIINILYLVQQGLLDIPILYLSRFITQNKADYYMVLQEVRTNNDWESLVLYLLKGVEVTAKQTITLITEIKALMQKHKVTIRTELSKIYSQDLINNLFKNPYTKMEYLENDLKVTRQTASSYLNKISNLGLLEKIKVGKVNYYINSELINVLVNV